MNPVSFSSSYTESIRDPEPALFRAIGSSFDHAIGIDIRSSFGPRSNSVKIHPVTGKLSLVQDPTIVMNEGRGTGSPFGQVS
jgi:hypothetical protein